MSIPQGGAIYIIQNMVSGGAYVGQTIKNPQRRWSEHSCALRHNRHGNPHMQFAWNKYGASAFEFCVLETFATIEETNNAECFYIEYFRAIGAYLYNCKTGGGNARASEESKAKMRAYQSTRPVETNAKMRAALLGVKRSEESKAKQSRANKGKRRVLSAVAKTSIADANRRRIGSKASDQTRAKISASGIGRNLGMKMSDDAKAKHSAAKLARNAERLGVGATQDPSYMFLSPNDEVVLVKSLTAFITTYNLHAGHVSSLVHGRRKKHQGWSFLGIGQ